jgi:RNA polymerase sigma factor (sigma-70 family)
MKDSRVVELFRACAGGGRDERAWAELVRRFEPRLRSGIARVLRRLEQPASAEVVDDLVQDVYCRLLERAGAGSPFRGESEGEVLVYLQRVCESVVVDALRGRFTRKRGGGARFVDVAADGGSLAEVVADGGATPEARCLHRELRTQLLDGCRRLLDGPARERNLTIFELAVLDGWTSREIAQAFDWGLRAGSIDSVVHRQRRKLRRHGLEAPAR